MPAQDVTPNSTWKVVGVNPSVDVSSGGQPVKGNQITFQTGLGHRGTVFVPDTTPVPDGVKAVVAVAASRVDAIATMTSEG